jgi:hypothetical protein
MITCWPSWRLSTSPTTRAATSVVPPAPKPTVMVIGLSGQAAPAGAAADP